MRTRMVRNKNNSETAELELLVLLLERTRIVRYCEIKNASWLKLNSKRNRTRQLNCRI
jgi:hypothetical protein